MANGLAFAWMEKAQELDKQLDALTAERDAMLKRAEKAEREASQIKQARVSLLTKLAALVERLNQANATIERLRGLLGKASRYAANAADEHNATRPTDTS